MKNNPVKKTTTLMTRRNFLYLTTTAAAGFVAGCAANPVTGESQLMLVSEGTEIRLDKENSPHQFSADYGTLQDTALNNYVAGLGRKMAAVTHRPHMPYSFRGVNAAYVNAYAFPGGSIAATRGILLALDNEAQLAALMGHELGHVNARHTAERMSKGVLISAVVSSATAYVSSESKIWGQVAAGLGGIGAGMLLARYSRENERQADDLGMKYMTRAGYSPEGMVGLMGLLKSMSKHKPSAIEMMFSTHPMSEERYRTAKKSASKKYKSMKKAALKRERYMDNTARLRRMKKAIYALQDGEQEMAKKSLKSAEKYFSKALRVAPRDYAGLLMMSKCLIASKQNQKARSFIRKAKEVYPNEPQAYHLSGMTNLFTKRYGASVRDFSAYEKKLPGNPNTVFFKGLALEKMGRKNESAREYNRFLQSVNQGEQAQYAYSRLVDWGYIKK